MRLASMTLRRYATRLLWPLLVILSLLAPDRTLAQTANDACLDCHDDDAMVSERGHPVGILAARFKGSIHGEQDCIDCHSAPGNYDDVPHYQTYTPVDCSGCHDDVVAVFKGSVHEDVLFDRDMTCTTCHTIHQRGERDTEALDGCG
ncbi:MAG TPA: hypothetical protein VFU38_05330, partial [Candidatus Krumholzibacteria bacterium]|nr:hypothetical protein [Candidatus Krumholzibacteria bacterium]